MLHQVERLMQKSMRHCPYLIGSNFCESCLCVAQNVVQVEHLVLTLVPEFRENKFQQAIRAHLLSWNIKPTEHVAMRISELLNLQRYFAPLMNNRTNHHFIFCSPYQNT